MSQRKIVIQADDSTLESLQTKLKTDPQFLANLGSDPKAALNSFGITIDDATAQSLKTHFSNLAGAGPGASPIVIAVGVAIAAAVAVP
jgi:hypothetical protein